MVILNQYVSSEIKLLVNSVDLLSTKKSQNRLEHHTDLFQGDKMIIRRGQTFQMEVELNRPFNSDTHKIHLDLKTGMLMDELSEWMSTHLKPT